MADRYFIESPITGEHAVLDGPEAHHLIHVMRAKPGCRVTLFDGSGAEFPAEVERVGRSDVQLTVLAREEIDRELPFALILGVALPKGDRQKWLVEKAVEVGVSRIVPLETARGVAQPVEKALDRLRRSVVEASKQCGRNRLLEIADPQSWRAFVASEAQATCRLLAHPAESATPHDKPGLLATLQQSLEAGSRAVLAVGPEGGFTDEEVAAALDAGWQGVDLGRRILRVETAAVALSAAIALGAAWKGR